MIRERSLPEVHAEDIEGSVCQGQEGQQEGCPAFLEQHRGAEGAGSQRKTAPQGPHNSRTI